MRYKVKKLSRIILLYGCCFLVVKFCYLLLSTKNYSKHPEDINTEEKHHWNFSVKTSLQTTKNIKNCDNHSQIINPKPLAKTELSDIFISVKTTKKYHNERVALLLETWWIFARTQV